MERALAVVLLSAMLLLTGCGEDLDVSQKEYDLIVGDTAEVYVSFSRWFEDFEDIELVSTCEELSVNATPMDFSKQGTMTARLRLLEYSEDPLKCIRFVTADYEKQVDVRVTPQRQASFNRIQFEEAPRFDITYPMNFDVVVLREGIARNLSLQFETASEGVVVNGVDAREFALEIVPTQVAATMTKSVNIEVENTGDLTRTVKLTPQLYVEEGGRFLKLDERKIILTATA